MSFLPEFWLSTATALLLGGLMGWFLRGDNSDKLDDIEKRWHKRFSELEGVNQHLLGKQKQTKKLASEHSILVSKLARMNKAAELTCQQLKLKNTRLTAMNQRLEQMGVELTDKEARIDELTSRLSDKDTLLNDQNIPPH